MRNAAETSQYRASVYKIVGAIPPGRVTTYGRIAALIPPPEGLAWTNYMRVGPRWVGYAMAACPGHLPWHRVVNAQGRISQRMGEGPDLQHNLLHDEGIVFNINQRIDLESYLWNPEQAWLQENGLLVSSGSEPGERQVTEDEQEEGT